MYKLLTRLSICFLIAGITVGCAGPESQEEAQTDEQITETTLQQDSDYSRAVTVIHPTEGNDVAGTVSFEQTGDSVHVTGEITGLEPGPHGFHVHQYGDCTAPDGSSAGGHYNPEDNPHGAPTDEERHVGDMGNIEAGENGTATLDYYDSVIELNGANSIIGHGVIVHGGEDDLESQPSGAAGARMGCGVIGIAEGAMDTGEEGNQ